MYRQRVLNIKSNPNKGDGTNLLDEWGPKIEGLTFESIDEVVIFVLEIYQNSIKKRLLGA